MQAIVKVEVNPEKRDTQTKKLRQMNDEACIFKKIIY